jgi:hypothetical protein
MQVPAKLNQEHIPEGTRIKLRESAHIHFTTKFKYIGSKENNKMSDNLDVKTRIAIANLQMGQMKEFFRCKNISQEGPRKFYTKQYH